MKQQELKVEKKEPTKNDQGKRTAAKAAPKKEPVQESTAEQKVDTILLKVVKSKYSAVIVAAFWLSGYFVGHYIGDIWHWFMNVL